MYRIALFASGTGTNAENIAHYFKGHKTIEVRLILSNNKDAYVLERAKKLNIPTVVFNKHQFNETSEIIDRLKAEEINLVVLAGFLWLIPDSLIAAFPNQIINIHPALLPKYGGKGMYGSKVHEEVVANHEKESGITIHFVNQEYDKGNILFQAKVEVLPNDSPDEVAHKVHELEYEYFPKVIEKLLLME